MGGSFRVASGIATDPRGYLYVADFYNHRLQVFDGNGNYITKLGGHGTGLGQFDGPTDLAFSNSGKIVVVDWGNHRLQSIPVK